ncbi:MAG: hypothetical protein MK085_04270 [Phycisphaerales bacterium]|nr:hypothetical protein [Phycisphaerales bacterium]
MIASLILPAVVAGVAVFFGSFLVWMVSKWHQEDVRALPDERGFLEALKAHGLPRGFYMWPNDTPEAMKTEAFKERWAKGPWGTINIRGGAPNFPRNLLLTLLVNIMVAFGTAATIGLVLGGVELESGTLVASPMCQVFTPVFIIGLMTYGFGSLCNDIFFGKQPRFIMTTILDGIILGGIQALVLMWMWPA